MENLKRATFSEGKVFRFLATLGMTVWGLGIFYEDFSLTT